jgi:hypothetical protein
MRDSSVQEANFRNIISRTAHDALAPPTVVCANVSEGRRGTCGSTVRVHTDVHNTEVKGRIRQPGGIQRHLSNTAYDFSTALHYSAYSTVDFVFATSSPL